MGSCSSGRRLSLSWVEEQVGWVGWSKVRRAFQVRTTCKKAERPERVWVGLGAVGDRAGKAGEWNRMNLHYGSSRKFSVLRGFSALWSGNRGGQQISEWRTEQQTKALRRLSRFRGWRLSLWRRLRRWLLCLWQCEERGASLGDGRGEKRKEKDWSGILRKN